MNSECNRKFGLMTQFPYARGRSFVCKNIGDYIQAVATRQFIPIIDEYVEQEELNTYVPDDKVPIKVVMNGWFQWRAENWPPSEYVYPLLISMHISPLKSEQILTDEGIKFLKRFGPVGCRDTSTKKLLEDKGIPAYFSACMTLTLGEQYYVSPKNKSGVCFVDPYINIPPIIECKDGNKKLYIGRIVRSIIYYIFHLGAINKLAKKSFFRVYSPTGFLDRNTNPLNKYYKVIQFYKTYSKKFDKAMLENAEYITHWLDVDMSGKVTNDDLLRTAEELVKKYASLSMVVTSRIHAGLPCLAVETPVVFISNEEVTNDGGNFNTPGRLGGLINLFRVLNILDGNFFTTDEVLKKIEVVTEKTTFENKKDWMSYAKNLKKMCVEFFA